MKTTKKEDYSIVLMMAMAKASEPLSLRAACEEYSLPYPFMKRIASTLVNRGILCAKGGSTGGYSLARSAQEISWKDILLAISGEPKFTSCVGDPSHVCPSGHICPAKNAWGKVNAAFLASMDNIKLSDFI